MPLQRRFEACVADWDGTLVPDRAADAGHLRSLVEDLCAAAFDVVVITGTHVLNIDNQLRARPRGPGRLVLCVNRGSEVFECGAQGPELVVRREATAAENAQLDRAAQLTVERLAARGVDAAIVAQRLNRRKVDIIPLPEWADPPKARIGELLAAVEARLHAAGIADVADVVTIAHAAAAEAGMVSPRISSDAKYVEIGLTDKADAAHWTFADLWARGITPADVLIAGDEFGVLGGVAGSDSLILVPESRGAVAVTVGEEPFGAPEGVMSLPGGPARMLEVLEDQLRRRRAGHPPEPRPGQVWGVAVDEAGQLTESLRSTVLTLGDGFMGTTGSGAAPAGASPVVRVAGFYEGEGPDEHLRPLPAWNQLPTSAAGGAQPSRVLDLRTGVVSSRFGAGEDQRHSVALSSLAEPGTAVLWVSGVSGGDAAVARGAHEEAVSTAQGGSVSIHVQDTLRRDGEGPVVLERIAVHSAGDGAVARARAQRAAAAGLNALHRAHREAWSTRWRDTDIEVCGDDDIQRDVRYSMFQLMGAVATQGEAALGARGLSGDGYRGHVFWDSDVFVVPFLAATCPRAARAMLEYRIRRLPPAMEEARARGREGAKFPWESASAGREITPSTVVGPRGETVVVRTGQMEEHIVADVAWAACRYTDWTADEDFARGPLQHLLVETARYWASRIDCDADGTAHIRHVIGPDEYHDDVDDNAFTNVMARWNLRSAAARAGASCESAEVRRWNSLADALVDGLDPWSLVYEEFAGFSALEPFPLRQAYGPAPFAADSVIGFDRIQALQVVKQADVLMLHLMVPDEVAAGSLAPNLDRYLPMTAHGSSLSPAVHAALLARAGRDAEALELFRYAAGLDIGGTAPSTAEGLHVATMGGVWLALVEGFGGIRADGDGLVVRPHLPAGWEGLNVNLVYRGTRAQVRIRDGAPPEVVTDGKLRVDVGGDGG